MLRAHGAVSRTQHHVLDELKRQLAQTRSGRALTSPVAPKSRHGGRGWALEGWTWTTEGGMEGKQAHSPLRAAQDFPEESCPLGIQLGCLATHPEVMAHSHPPPRGPIPQSSFVAVVVLALGVYNPCLRLCFVGTLTETEAGVLGNGWGDTGEAGQGWGHCCVSAPVRYCGVREGVDRWTLPSKSPPHCAWALGGDWNPARGPDGRLKD